MTVFVLSSNGSWVAHGPVRKSAGQADRVAKALRSKLGWVAQAAELAPSPVALEDRPKGLPGAGTAGTSPVWKNPGLAARWNS